ncbi:MAG: hypothetical protein Q4D87_04725 [Actinomycetaceae bacterium]|nr:hypothetical protein [Actinomycetaceae bacterium]
MDTTENKSAFEAITTQEAPDKIVENRLARERAKYTDYQELKAKAGKLDQTVAELDTTKASLEQAQGRVEELTKQRDLTALKTQVAKEAGVPADMLHGDSEEALRELVRLEADTALIDRFKRVAAGQHHELRVCTRVLPTSR